MFVFARLTGLYADVTCIRKETWLNNTIIILLLLLLQKNIMQHPDIILPLYRPSLVKRSFVEFLTFLMHVGLHVTNIQCYVTKPLN